MAVRYWTSGTDGARGPFDQQQVRELVASGQLTRAMEISADDGKTWHVAGKVKGLFPAQEMQPKLDFGSQLDQPATSVSPPPPMRSGLQQQSGPEPSRLTESTGPSGKPLIATQRPDAAPTTPKLMRAFAESVLALAFLYFGGWFIAWGAIVPGYSDDLYIGHGIAMRLNGLYYGLVFAPRFFDAPLLSFILGGLGLGAASTAFNELDGK